ncbi:MAG: prolyl-tRNA synthetase associated domain-containing protein [Firmicutes bacterium]|nr:prolyl-tRNA synthetase associated domain-containing protein [Bacillota bacterium]
MLLKQEILNLLDQRSIQYELYEHEPIKTVSESQELGLPHQEWATKNFFLRDKKKKNYFIISTQENKPVDLRTIREILGTSALSFASGEDLEGMLGIISGAVSPFGALNDESMKVKVYIDRLFEGNLMDAHPNDNAATLFLQADDVLRVIRESGRAAEYIDLPEKAAETIE